MKSLFTLLLILVISFPSFSQETNSQITSTTYYLIRHAEKDRSDDSNEDPELTDQGKVRAENWSTILQHVKFHDVYSTQYNRTLQTAQPIADSNNLEVSLYDPSNLFSEEFAEATFGKTILVVGHSNTTPAFVNAILGENKYEDIDDDNNGNLYIVTITLGGEKSDHVLTIN